jgi:hypothetical protein
VNGQLLIRADSFAQQVSKVVREAVSEPVAVTTESELEEKHSISPVPIALKSGRPGRLPLPVLILVVNDLKPGRFKVQNKPGQLRLHFREKIQAVLLDSAAIEKTNEDESKTVPNNQFLISTASRPRSCLRTKSKVCSRY